MRYERGRKRQTCEYFFFNSRLFLFGRIEKIIRTGRIVEHTKSDMLACSIGKLVLPLCWLIKGSECRYL